MARVPLVRVKDLRFTPFLFDDILERKEAFLDSKVRKLRKSKNQDFNKGVSPWFW